MRKLLAFAACGALALGAAACGSDDDDDDGGGGGGGGDLSGTIRIDGSSTVGPFAQAAQEAFQGENPGVRITVAQSGTGGGFEKFCAGETDISDASRAIEEDEVKLCEKNNVAFEELQVANDGLTVVVNPNNDWASCLTVDELKKVWEPKSQVNNWSQVNPDFPDTEMELFGAGTDSGTFDYFTEAINGEEGASRTDYNATEDDNVTVQGVQGSEGAMGYFGLSYAQQNPDAVKPVEIDGGDGCVAPSAETVQDGSYKPLSRPLFIYPSAEALQRPEVKAFVEFYLENQQQITEQALFVPMTEEQLAESQDKVAKLAG